MNAIKCPSFRGVRLIEVIFNRKLRWDIDKCLREVSVLWGVRLKRFYCILTVPILEITLVTDNVLLNHSCTFGLGKF